MVNYGDSFRRAIIVQGIVKRYSIRSIKRRCNLSDPNRRRKSFTRHEKLKIYAAYKAGFPTVRVADMAGVSKSHLQKALVRGNDPDEKIDYAFKSQIKRIKGAQEKINLNIIREVAKGGGKITETKIQIKSYEKAGKKGKKGKKAKKQIEQKEVQTIIKEKGPVWQAAAWMLERAYKEYHLQSRYDLAERNVEDVAIDIKNAVDKLFDSVPAKPEENE